MKSLTDLRVVLVIHRKNGFFCSSEIQKLLGYSMTELKIFHLFILSIYTTLLKLLLKAVCWTLVSCETTDGVDDQKSTQYLSGWNSKRLRFCVSQGTRICEKKTNIFLCSWYYVPFKRSIERLIEYFELDYFHRIAKLFNHNELEAIKDRKDKFKRWDVIFCTSRELTG